MYGMYIVNIVLYDCLLLPTKQNLVYLKIKNVLKPLLTAFLCLFLLNNTRRCVGINDKNITYFFY